MTWLAQQQPFPRDVAQNDQPIYWDPVRSLGVGSNEAFCGTWRVALSVKSQVLEAAPPSRKH